MEIDLTRLTRDYKNNPLKRGETIPKQDLEYLFIEANLTLKQMANIINRHPNQIGRQCKDKNVVKNRVVTNPITNVTPEQPIIDKPNKDIHNLVIECFDSVFIDYKYKDVRWDYYIPKLDLYIMYHIDESHGGEPFCSTNLEHWKKIKFWANEAQNRNYTDSQKNYYANLINTWTITDVLARNTAKHYNLNFLEFFTENSFLNWCKNHKNL